MGQSTFKGGAHPYEGKELSMDSPIREMDAKEELVFPMSQHIGAPATPVVAVGDTVKMGQIIGEASGFISANIVSSVSGEVKAVEPRLLSSGAKATCVVIAKMPALSVWEEPDSRQTLKLRRKMKKKLIMSL